MTTMHTRLATLRAAVLAAGHHVLRRDGHVRIEVTGVVRVVTHLGAARLVSITDDAYCECQLDGEHRRDEYPVALVVLDA